MKRPCSTPARCDVPRAFRAAAVLVALTAGGASPARAAPERVHDFGTVSFGVGGGFQWWSLNSLEDAVRERADDLARDGYDLGHTSFDPSYAYCGEIQVRLGRSWFARAGLEWVRLAVEDRDRQFLQFLGGRGRTPVSLSYRTEVGTRPVVAAFGLGRAWRSRSVRLGLATSLVVAPLRVTDEINVYMDTETVSEARADGTGLGGEVSASLDYFTDVDMNLFLEFFARQGQVDVRMEDPVWDSTILPDRRQVDLSGFGIRAGFRWI